MFRIVSLALLLTGCATASSEEIQGPDGKMSQSISCKRSVEACYKEAGRVCPDGYKIVDKTDEGRVTMINKNLVTSTRFNLLVTCKASGDTAH